MASIGLARRNSTPTPSGARVISNSSAADIETTVASTPSDWPGRSCLAAQVVMAGVPGSPMRISSMPEPSSSFEACRK